MYSYPHILSSKVSLVKTLPLFFISISNSSNSFNVKSTFSPSFTTSCLLKSTDILEKLKALSEVGVVLILLKTALTLARSSLIENGFVI
ncbi:hypothetical protein D3C73_1231110 [compost metagenome]